LTIVVVAADLVLRQKLHLPDGHGLLVRWLTANNESLASPRTVEVAGAVRDVGKEYLLMYFENEMKSGGGNVEDVHIFDDNTAYVTFESSEGTELGGQLLFALT